MTEEYGHISDAFDNLPEENLLLSEEQLERVRRATCRVERARCAERVLERYNRFYNDECSGLTWGTHITPEFQQAMTLECMLDALRWENMNSEFDVVSTADINDLINGLYQQGKDYLERVNNNG